MHHKKGAPCHVSKDKLHPLEMHGLVSTGESHVQARLVR